MKRKLVCGAAASAVAAAILVGPAPAATPTISGVVGPGFTINMTKKPAKAGTFRLVVDDKSSSHNFRLTGPGVSIATSVPEVGKRTFTVKLRAGATYRFVCDPHSSTMKGSFRVPNAPAAKATISGVVGPGFTISMTKTPVKAGTYQLVVDDKSNFHNFRLAGPGVNVATGVPEVGKRTFTVKLVAGATYRFVCDPHSSTMKGSFTVPE